MMTVFVLYIGFIGMPHAEWVESSRWLERVQCEREAIDLMTFEHKQPNLLAECRVEKTPAY